MSADRWGGAGSDALRVKARGRGVWQGSPAASLTPAGMW